MGTLKSDETPKNGFRKRRGFGRSTLNVTPLAMASKSFSYLDTESIVTRNWGNIFLLNAANKHLETYKLVEVTFDASILNNKITTEAMNIKYDRIAQNITHLRFTGIDQYSLLTPSMQNFLKVLRCCKNTQKICFEGHVADMLLLCFDSTVESVLQLTSQWKDVRELQFQSTTNYVLMREGYKDYISKIFHTWKL